MSRTIPLSGTTDVDEQRFSVLPGRPRTTVPCMSTDTSAAGTRSRHVGRVIHCPPARVYDFVADPENLPEWAGGLAQSKVEREGDVVLADSPMGRVRVRFTPRNDLGVLDHDVILPSGETVNNPVRVLAHPDGAEIVFTIRQIGLSDEEFDRDTQMVIQDLERLRTLLES